MSRKHVLIPWERYQSLIALENSQEDLKTEVDCADGVVWEPDRSGKVETSAAVANNVFQSAVGGVVQELNRSDKVKASGED